MIGGKGRAGLCDGPVPADADGGWLQDIAGETYVVAPACFEAFAAGRDLAAAIVRNRVVRLLEGVRDLARPVVTGKMVTVRIGYLQPTRG